MYETLHFHSQHLFHVRDSRRGKIRRVWIRETTLFFVARSFRLTRDTSVVIRGFWLPVSFALGSSPRFTANSSFSTDGNRVMFRKSPRWWTVSRFAGSLRFFMFASAKRVRGNFELKQTWFGFQKLKIS